MARKSRRTRRLRVVNPDCAGIDIGKGRHFVAVEAERSVEPVRSFGSFTRDLEEMAAWLASCGVTKVAMESTSVYWIPVYECQSAFNLDPRSACKTDPPERHVRGTVEVVPVANRGDPRGFA